MTARDEAAARRLGLAQVAIALPVLVGAAALGRSSGIVALGLIVAALAAALAIVGERWEMDAGRQLVACLLGGGVGYALVSLLYEDGPGTLREGWTRVAASALLAGAARFVQVRPRGGRALTLALAFVALVAAGQSQAWKGYPTFVVAFLAASLAALAFGEDQEGARLPGLRHSLVALAIIAIAGSAAATLIVGVRRGHAWLMRRAQSRYVMWRVRTGFSDRMELGALDGLAESSTVVLRIRGPRVDYLRGAAFDLYEHGCWLRSDALEKEAEVDWAPPPPAPPDALVEIRGVSDRVSRYFLPFDAASIELSPASVRVDGLGIIKPREPPLAPVARFVVAPRDRAPVAPPGPADLTLWRSGRAQLTPLAEEWTRGAATVEEQLDAIEQRLASDFRYARSFSRTGSLDPVLEFVLHDRTGHCEYFASAMALLARARGIPARLVTGYRVAEHSELGGYHVVRERNAHAWVEAWIEGKGWVTRDPTPPEAVPQNQPHEAELLAGAIDRLSVAWEGATDWLGARTLGQTAAATVVAFGVLAWIIARGARGTRAKASPVREDEQPLPCLTALLEALSRAGYVRDASEPLERLARRVPDVRAAELLVAYAALRYGARGDEAGLARAMEEHAARLRSSGSKALRV